MKSKSLIILSLALVPALFACSSESGGGGSGGSGMGGNGSGGNGSGGNGSGGGIACTTEARSSVTVKVVDAQGMPVTDAVVTYTVDGGASQNAECVNPLGGMGNCQEWVAGYEIAGNFVITATSADGMKTATQMVTVAKDECHVISQTATLTLQ